MEISARSEPARPGKYTEADQSEPKPPNVEFTTARERLLSPSGSGRPMSTQELADAINKHLAYPIDRKYIARLERGEIRWPQADRRAALRLVLKVDSDRDIGLRIDRRTPSRVTTDERIEPGPAFGATTAEPAGRESTEVMSQDMERRTLLAWGVAAGATRLAGTGKAQARTRALSATPRLTPNTTGHIETIVSSCRRQEDTLGPQAVLETISAQEHLVRRALPSVAEDLLPRVLSLHANILRSIGWMLFNLNDFTGADRYFAKARTAAHQAEDDAMTSFVLANWSQLATWRGDPREGVEHALGAVAWGQRAGSNLLVAYACDVGARAYSSIVHHSNTRERRGDRVAAMQLLDQAAHGLADAQDGDVGSAMLHFYDEGLQQSTRTSCLLDLNDTADALPLAQQAVETIDPAFVRNLAYARLFLARAHGQPGPALSLEQAVHHIGEAAELSRHNTSPRLTSSVRAARRTLDPWSKDASVKHLDDRLRVLASSR